MASKAVKSKKTEKKEEAPSTEGGGSTKGKRAQRATSNVFAMFTQTQMEEFKEAFQLIDNNKDGVIDKHDLRKTYESLGISATESELEKMMSEAPGAINFTMFLTLFGEKFASVADPEELGMAFKAWDPEIKGLVDEDTIRHDLMTWGDKFTTQECDLALRDAPIYEKEGKSWIDYPNYVKVICGGEEEE